jgi:hypothetical protein
METKELERKDVSRQGWVRINEGTLLNITTGNRLILREEGAKFLIPGAESPIYIDLQHGRDLWKYLMRYTS